MTFETNQDTTSDIVDAASVAPIATPATVTKEEKIKRVETQIRNLQEKLYNLQNDIVTVKAAKTVAIPEVGTTITFSYGRRTSGTAPVRYVGTITAIKPAGLNDAGVKTPAQLKVSVGEGFDQAFYVIYPAQIIDTSAEEAAENEVI